MPLLLTLPVRRYLLPTPSMKEVEPTPLPMISKTVDSTNLNFGRPLGLRGRNPVVNDPSRVRFPWQLIYVRVFSAKFC